MADFYSSLLLKIQNVRAQHPTVFEVQSSPARCHCYRRPSLHWDSGRTEKIADLCSSLHLNQPVGPLKVSAQDFRTFTGTLDRIQRPFVMLSSRHSSLGSVLAPRVESTCCPPLC